ncbi:MAG: DUF3179 domain-containing (seleno)protein [Planctomycetaceae bacterium]
MRRIRILFGGVMIALWLSAFACAQPRGTLFELPGAFPELTRPPAMPGTSIVPLSDEELVVGLQRGGRSRAYPLRVLGDHRVINDDLAGPVAITWDVDAGMARALVPQVGAQRLTLRFQGWYLGVMVLRDAETGSLWSPLTGYCLAGVHRGAQLTSLPLVVGAWADWRLRAPQTEVPNVDYAARYRTSYPRTMLQLSPQATHSLGPIDGRRPPETRVVGVVLGGVAKAWPVAALRRCQVEMLGDRGVVICQGTDGGLSAFEPRLSGKPLTLGVVEIDGRPQLLGPDGTLVDPSGKITVGILAGTDLPTVDIVETSWWAWSSYYPNTLVDGLPGTATGASAPILLPGPVIPPTPPSDPIRPNARKIRRDRRKTGR